MAGHKPSASALLYKPYLSHTPKYIRNKASLNIDESGIHTLFISDIYERVWPQTIRTLETIGVQLINTKESDGIIEKTLYLTLN